MISTTTSLPREQGVLLAESDYAGFLRRTLSLLIDAFVLILAWIVIAVYFVQMGLDPTGEGELALSVWPLIVWVYLAVLKQSRGRTIGYRVTGLRIVDYQGRCPSILRMTSRLLLSSTGVFAFWTDIWWVASDRQGQSLHDKAAGTFVVRMDATPVSMGRRKAVYIDFQCWMLLLWEVHPPTTGAR